MKNINVSFDGTPVLRNARFTVRPGEITALLGENGAGKTTLMNILGGVNQKYTGEILIDGQPVTFENPGASMAAGIGFVHQELNLINDLTVYENMFIGEFPKKGIFLDRKRMQRETDDFLQKMQVHVDSGTPVRNLDASYRQLLEICRTLRSNAKVLIMDEPTASLPDREINRVFDLMRHLKAQGVGIVFISHKLNEVMAVCDRYTVLRNGECVAEGLVNETDPYRLAALIVGHNLNRSERTKAAAIGEEVLSLKDWGNETSFRHISLSIRAGEVVGVTGLLGDGRSELFQSVFGCNTRRVTGEMRLCGRSVRFRNTHAAAKAGIAYVPGNRMENGIIQDMSVQDNGTAASWDLLKHGMGFDREKQKSLFEHQREKLKIKVENENSLITTLSGGNQQKVLLGKWSCVNPKLLVLNNPTQGVDIGAKEEIYRSIRATAASGVAVAVLSSDAREIVQVCDRAVVLFHGEIAGEVAWEDMTEQNLMFYATGGGKTVEKTEEPHG